MGNALVMSVLSGPATAAQQTTLAAQPQTNAAAFRDQIGRRLTFICPAHVNINQDIYGTDVYSDTSPICTAAAHAGVFTGDTPTAVTILMAGEVPELKASTRNKVQSLAYGRWVGSYSFVRDGRPGQIDWHTTIVQVDKDYSTPITVVCPPAGGSAQGDIWGTDVYPDDSAICVAGVHTGAITLAGGMLTVTRVPKQASFPSTTRHEITSRMWSDPAWRSYPQPYTVAGAGAVTTPLLNGVLVQPTPTTATATPMTPGTGVSAPISTTAGPIATSSRSATSSRTDLFAPPPPRTISISPFTASARVLPQARLLTLPSFAAGGTGNAVLSQTSGVATIAPRVITLPAFASTGRNEIAPRTIKLPTFTAVGVP